ncbi:fructose-bisphosphate aldolase-lysine N-methyltransferase, chloroplastic isoform X2 [Aristolochia californica]|uniref:fructose-bisphosphate aldolase-lysine N-methyltransferase, chloroplastic isoform X2 n=1 Tax=Aristolochia californica TaxID=171875 RepID=UPI0035E39721
MIWLGTRIMNLCFHPPLLLRSSAVCLRLASAATVYENLKCLNQYSTEFLSWLQHKAGLEISSTLAVGNSIYGRSLFASDTIKAGDCILRVPYSVQISPENIVPEIKVLLNDDLSNVAKLAAVLLAEQKMGQSSEWATYVNSLPRHGELHSTVFWSEDELEMIRQSPVYQETICHQAKIESEYLKVFELFPQRFSGISLEDFMHAYALVASRAWGTSKGLSLIPFADFLNHDGLSGSVLLSDEDKRISEVIADRDYAVGEEVFIRYGKYSNATLMLDFGFTLSHNIYDQVQIWMAVSEHDPLCAEKVELLHKHSMPTIICEKGGVNYHGNLFTIKEVRSARGTGKGIPQSLRAFARVLSMTFHQELDDLATEATQNDGRLARRPLGNKNREVESHRILLLEITNMVREYIASIKLLRKESSHSIRRQMASDLLTGELRVLKSASAWLMNYSALSPPSKLDLS